ncbi:Uncharacterised protein [Mycobacteroides abscessus subsp. abscessus]|nr:Uncharacterised protein [Mycobacteroides abscessus subsp. abscessus]
MRVTCGTMRPTNPIAPQTETMNPVISAAMTKSSSRNRDARMPSDAATSSPIASALSCRALAATTPIPMTTTTATNTTECHVAAARLPSSQNMTLRAASPTGRKKMSTVVRAENPYPRAVPVNTSRSGVRPPPRWAIPKTSNVASSAPRNAAVGNA